MPGGALDGIRVVDFGQMVSAPFCAKLFSDYGADVIKVELPAGDAARYTGPFPQDVPHPEKSGLFFVNNTNKRGVTCDVATAAGKALFLRLLEWADVLIENNLPKQMLDWGLDYESMARVNDNLVVISITPFGQTGPYSSWNAYDLPRIILVQSAPLHGVWPQSMAGAMRAADNRWMSPVPRR
jgi:crotonobetainyl-CoA:carnitine CoA-transferase CaiB-like acyl-CoA transferase